MVLERVESTVPEPAVPTKPLVQLRQRLRIEAIHPALAVGANRDQPGLSEHAQVPRDRRLRERELLDELIDRPLALGQKLHHLSASAVGEDRERLHTKLI